jgi:hypothetical protein
MTDEIVDALHRAGWSIGLTAFHSTAGGFVWVVSGHNGENLIRAEGATKAAAWWSALDQARAVGMVPGWRISEPGVG